MSNDSQSPVMSDLEWLAREVSEWPDATALRRDSDFTDGYCFTLNDPSGLSDAWCIRTQWAAERQRLGLDQEWDEGLPSVGDQLWVTLRPDEDGCRIADFDDVTVEVIGLAQTSAGDPVVTFAHPTLGLGCGHYDPSVFRPARTPDEVEREELIRVIASQGFLNTTGNVSGEIADAILAAGYRKQGEPS